MKTYEDTLTEWIVRHVPQDQWTGGIVHPGMDVEPFYPGRTVVVWEDDSGKTVEFSVEPDTFCREFLEIGQEPVTDEVRL